MNLRAFDKGAFCEHTLPAFSSLSVVSLDCPPGFGDKSLLAIMCHQTISVIRLHGGSSWKTRSNGITDFGFITAAVSAPVGNLVELRVSHFNLTDDISVCFGRFANLEHSDLSFTDVHEECFSSCRLMPMLSCLVLAGFDFLSCCDFSHLNQMKRLCHFDIRASGCIGFDGDTGTIDVLKEVMDGLPHLMTVRYIGVAEDKDVIRHACGSLDNRS